MEKISGSPADRDRINFIWWNMETVEKLNKYFVSVFREEDTENLRKYWRTTGLTRMRRRN